MIIRSAYQATYNVGFKVSCDNCKLEIIDTAIHPIVGYTHYIIAYIRDKGWYVPEGTRKTYCKVCKEELYLGREEK